MTVAACRRCGGTGIEAPGGYGLHWGDLLVERSTGEVVEVRWIGCRQMVVWGLCAVGRSGSVRVLTRAHEWRDRFLLLARRRW
jgi:hypothetical protein